MGTRIFTYLQIGICDNGLKGLAKYKVKEPTTDVEVIDEKIHRWAASKNLKKPTIPKDRDGFISKDTVRDIRKGDICEREIERLYPDIQLQTYVHI